MRTWLFATRRHKFSPDSLVGVLTIVSARAHSPANNKTPSSSFVRSFHLALEFSCTIFDTFIIFLDISFSIHHSALATSIHPKPTGSLSYLYCSSSPTLFTPNSPYPIFNSSNSDNLDFETQSGLMAHHFTVRGYPLITIHASFDSTQSADPTSVLFLPAPASQWPVSRVPLSTTFPLCPSNAQFSKLSRKSSSIRPLPISFLTYPFPPSNEHLTI